MGCCFPKPSNGKKADKNYSTTTSGSVRNLSPSLGNIFYQNNGVIIPSKGRDSSLYTSNQFGLVHQNYRANEPSTIVQIPVSSHRSNQFGKALNQSNVGKSTFSSFQNTCTSHTSNQSRRVGSQNTAVNTIQSSLGSVRSNKAENSFKQNNCSTTISNQDFNSNLTHSPVIISNEIRDRTPKLPEPVMKLLKLVFQDDFGDDHRMALFKLKQLGTTIKLLSKNEPDYRMICKYVKNSQGPTHSFRVSIENIYIGYRWGKLKDFKPLKKLGNRKLLWHGTQISNYVSILSSGLLTVPPSSASVTGKMFGNGIYFADVITKSAQYCKADKLNPYGILILAQVALGNEYVLTKSENVMKLPDGKNCVKGIGKYQHKESENFRTKYGVQVPCGTLELRNDISTSLRYNEYVVYNSEQILFEYLVLLKFDF